MVRTATFVGRLGLDGSVAQRVGCLLRRDDVDHHAGTAFETCGGGEFWKQVHVPVVHACMVRRSSVEDKVEGNVTE